MKYATAISQQIRSLVQILLVLTPLAGCSSFIHPPPCPNVFALADARQFDRFRAGGTKASDIDFAVRLDEWKGACTYNQQGDMWDVIVELEPIFIVKRGPANTSGTAQFQYFEAVPALFPLVYGKQTNTASMTFPAGVNTVRLTGEHISVSFSIKGNEVVDTYTVYLGLQMTPEEIERNRRDK
jgi:hypothetical protein